MYENTKIEYFYKCIEVHCKKIQILNMIKFMKEPVERVDIRINLVSFFPWLQLMKIPTSRYQENFLR